MTESFAIAPTTGAGLQDWGVLTVEQEIRARALDVAGRKFGSFGYDTDELLANADRLADYIRTGAPDPHVAAVLEAAVVWRLHSGPNATAAGPDQWEGPLIAAIDGLLASRNALRGSAEERSDDPSNASDLGEVS